MKKKKSLRVKFYLYEESKKNNKFQIYCRISYNRNKTEIATGIFVAKNNWDENFEGHCQKSHKVNEEISNIKGDIIKIKNQLEYEERPISAKILKRIYTGEEQLKVFLLKYFEDLINKQFDVDEDRSRKDFRDACDGVRANMSFDKIYNMLAQSEKAKEKGKYADKYIRMTIHNAFIAVKKY